MCQERIDRLLSENISLRTALQEAYNLRVALCENSDPSSNPENPVNWDKPLQRWLHVLNSLEQFIIF
jgi:hypothetical protein